MKFLIPLLLLCLTCEAQVSQRRRLMLPSAAVLTVTNDLVLWLKADNVTNVLDNSEAREWRDASTNNKPCTTSGTPVTWRMNQQNGKPAMDFNGTDQNFGSAAIPTISTSNSMYIVFKPDATNALQFPFRMGTSQGTGFEILATGLRAVLHRAVADCSDGPATTTIEQWSSVRTAVPLESMWVARTNVTIANSGSGMTSPNISYRVGSFDGVTGFFNGLIFEILVYELPHSTADRQAVENYLARKYALP